MTRTACLNMIYELAKYDERVVFIGSDLAPNTLPQFKTEFPDRYFMEGVQEQNIIGMASGLALEGFIPYINTISTFITRRCYEQIAIDICAHNLPVRLIGNGGGLVYAPLGCTHTAIEDIAIMRALPNMVIANPADNDEMVDIMKMSIHIDKPMYIRLGRDTDPKYHEEFCYPNSILIVSTGRMSEIAFRTRQLLRASCNIFHTPFIKPFQNVTFLERLSGAEMIVTMEEGVVNGGLGSAVLECLADNNIQIPVLRFGIPDEYPSHYGEQQDLFETYGLTPEKMAEKIRGFYEKLLDA